MNTGGTMPNQTASAYETPSIRILLIEDNANDEALLLRQLKKAGLDKQVRVIAHGGRALDYLIEKQNRAEELVAVFLDLQLPKIPGLKLLEAIRSEERIKHLPVIVMTSSNAPETLNRCKELGVSSYVTKPVTFAAFTKAVADTFHSRTDAIRHTRVGEQLTSPTSPSWRG